MSEIVYEQMSNFDGIATKLYTNASVGEAVDLLFSELRERRAHQSPESWKQFITTNCRQSPLLGLMHQDPLSSRAFIKPRGYAGDAEMLDLVYAIEDGETLPALERSSELGRRIYHCTANQEAARAVRSRRWIIIDKLNALAERIASPHVLSLACGHLREARHCSAMMQGRFGRFVAADQDRQSLAVVEREAGNLGVEAVATSVRTILKGEVSLGNFDYIYASGLYDYLPQAVAQKLTERLFAMLTPGGRLLLANFLPSNRNAAFMEAYMDWWLIYRTKSEMLALVNTLPEKEMGQCHLFTEENETIVFLEVERQR